MLNQIVLKKKLTLAINEDVIKAAKLYAQRGGRSLSDIVESYLLFLTDKTEEMPVLSPKATKLLGVISLPHDFDYKKERSNPLIEKDHSA